MEHIFENSNEMISIVRETNKGEKVQCGEFLDKTSSLHEGIMKELNLPFHRSVIKLNQCIRNLMKDKEGPNVLLLSKNEGGFAKRGIKIQDKYYENLNYVDLVIDEKRLEQGNLHIFSHELGHVMIQNLFKNFPKGRSTKQHVSMGVTDYFMAFDEGWAMHFERLAYDLIDKYREVKDSRAKRDLVKWWLCEADGEFRINGVANNSYIYKKVTEPFHNLDTNIVNKIILEHTTTIFNNYRVKNPQEMLSCEGVIATLFYRINTNKKLQDSYENHEFYNKFLIKNLDKEMDVKDIFTPLENVILKTIWVWYKMRDKINENCTPFIEFVESWGDCFPKDKEEVTDIFITTTLGKTVDNTLSGIYEKASYKGMMGDIKGFEKQIIIYRDGLLRLCKEIKEGQREIDENLGRELWLENTEVKIPRYFWGTDELVPLVININTASVYDLMSFHHMTLEKANKILEKREVMGYFSSVDDIKEIYSFKKD